MTNPTISAVHYYLGETRLALGIDTKWTDQVMEVLGQDQLLDLGCKNCHASEKNVFELGVESAKLTLAMSPIGSKEIDLVFICSTNFGGLENGKADQALHTITSNLKLSNVQIIGVTLSNCVALFATIRLAASLLKERQYHNILIITADKLPSTSPRVTQYCFYSDSAASFILSHRRTGFELLGEAFGSSDVFLEHNLLADIGLYRRVNGEMEAFGGIADIRMAFANNVFLPILLVKETAAGLEESQLYRDNIPRIGHCFSADPIIGLSDFMAKGFLLGGEKFLLIGNSPGQRALLSLRYVGA